MVRLVFLVVGALLVLWASGFLAAPGQLGTCRIKGNISASGERIYHVRSGQYYDRTKISPSKGERWFCSEAEAQGAGWRRSRR